MSHRMVLCPTCDLVYVDLPPPREALAEAYHAAGYDTADEADDAADAYMRAVRPVLGRLPTRQRVLEIGTGTGAFLERLRREGFTDLLGVEPSPAAIAAAPAERRGWIREAVFNEADYAPESFDLICCFMTLEHVHDPRTTSAAALRLLRPGGAFVTVTHDYRSLANRLLGRRSPIVDVEHMQLFSGHSIHELMRRCGFTGIHVRRFANAYPLRYWLRLMPMPKALRRGLHAALITTRMDKVRLSLRVGNTLAIGFRSR